MLEENLHLPCTSLQVSSRPRDIPTLEGIQRSLSAPQQRRDVRFVLPGVWHRQFKARGFSYFPARKQNATLVLLPFGLVTAQQALAQPCEEPLQIHQCSSFLYWRCSHTCICLYCFSEAYQHSVVNTTFHRKKCPSRWEGSPGLAGIILDWRQEAFG